MRLDWFSALLLPGVPGVLAQYKVLCWGQYPVDEGGVTGVTQFTVGDRFACVLTPAGTVGCYGSGTAVTALPSDLPPVRSIGAGQSHVCAVTAASREVRCWGSGSTNVPATLPGVTKEVAGSSKAAGVLNEAGQVTVWAGPGQASYRLQNVPSDLPPIEHLAIGRFHACASWGPNIRCWDPTPSYDLEQEDTPTLTSPVTKMSCGILHCCVVTADGQVTCWGDGDHVGRKKRFFGQSLVPTGMPPSKDVVVGWDHSCAWHVNGQVTCWGKSVNGQLDTPSDVTIFALGASNFNTCAVVQDGTVTTSTTSLTTSTVLTTTATTSTATTTTETSTTSSTSLTTSETSTTSTSKTTTMTTTSTSTVTSSSTSSSSSSSTTTWTTLGFLSLKELVELIILRVQFKTTELITALTPGQPALEKYNMELGLSLPNATATQAVFKMAAGDAGARSFLMPDSEVNVTVPAGFIAELGGGEDLAMAVAFIDKEAAKAVGAEGGLYLGISGATGGYVNTTLLPQPLEFVLPVNSSQGFVCAYWDEVERKWSKEGVTTFPVPPGSPMQCSTTHLSFFGAIFESFINTFLCSNIGLFSADGFAALQESAWMSDPGSILLWVYLAVVTAMMAAAVKLDSTRQRDFGWTEAHFLLPPPPPQPERTETGDAEEEEERPQEKEPGFCCRACNVVKGLFAGFCAFMQGSVCCDMMDEVLSNWFEYWGELRGIVEGIFEGLDLQAACASGGTSRNRFTFKILKRLILTSARHLAGARLWLSDDVVSFVMDDEDLRDSLTDRNSRRASTTSWDSSGRSRMATWDYWKSCGPEDCADGWAQLRTAVDQSFTKGILQHHEWRRPKMLFGLFVMNNPMGTALLFNIFQNCKISLLFLFADTMGSLMVTSIFFEASGVQYGKRGKAVGGGGDPACDSDGEDFSIGRLLAIALTSNILAGLPIGLLQSMRTAGFKRVEPEQREKQLKVWATQDKVVCVLTLLYSLVCLLFVLLFLANVVGDDQVSWMQTVLFMFFMDYVAMPIILVVFIPMTAEAMMCCHVNREVSRHEILSEAHRDLQNETNMMLPIERI